MVMRSQHQFWSPFSRRIPGNPGPNGHRRVFPVIAVFPGQMAERTTYRFYKVTRLSREALWLIVAVMSFETNDPGKLIRQGRLENKRKSSVDQDRTG